MAVRPGRWQYRLPDLWSLLLVGYHSRARLGDESHVIRPGMIMFMEPGVPKDYRHSEHGAHHVVHFRAGVAADDPPRLPLAFDPGLLGGPVRDRMERVVQSFPERTDRAEIALWDLLYLLDDVAGPPTGPDVIDDLTARIDADLHTRLSVGELVAESGYSHGHLLQLFHDRHGESIVGYIRRRRMEQARYLLGTDMPIVGIAAQIGIPDVQAFNKAIRQAYGCGPRELRSRLTGGRRSSRRLPAARAT